MKINNLDWKIVYDDNMNENTHGQTNYETLTIYIRPQCCVQNQKRTLLHELCHAYCYSYGLMFIETFDRENLCEFISHNLENLVDLYAEGLKTLISGGDKK